MMSWGGRRTVCLLVALLTSGASVAGAQDGGAQPARHRLFAGASVFDAARPAGDGDYHYITPMLGGSTASLGGTVGISIARALGASCEVSWLGTLSAPFNFDHFLRQYATATQNEVLIAVLVRVTQMKTRVRVEPVAGVFFTVEHIVLTDRRDPGPWYAPSVTPLPDASHTNVYTGVGGGADVVGDLTTRVAIVGVFRFASFPSRLDFPSAGTDAESVGIGKATFQVGVGLRYSFR